MGREPDECSSIYELLFAEQGMEDCNCTLRRGIALNESTDFRKSIVESMLQDPETIIQNLETTSDIRGIAVEQVIKLASRINEAPIVYWRDDLLQAATSGWEIWIDHSPDAFPLLNRQLWVFEKPWRMRCGAHPKECDVEVLRGTTDSPDIVKPNTPGFNTLYLDRDWLPDAWVIYSVFHAPPEDTGTCALNCFLGMIPAGAKCAGDGAAEIIAAMAFMKLKVTKLEQQVPSRAIRRQYQRAGTTLPDVRIVTLRRTSTRGSGKNSDVNWSCQWVVGGHWRNQWYESRQAHEPVYILPYVKGPKEKPLRVPKQVLYKVAK